MRSDMLTQSQQMLAQQPFSPSLTRDSMRTRCAAAQGTIRKAV